MGGCVGRRGGSGAAQFGEDGGGDGFGGDFEHATEVDRAGAAEAGGAFDVAADDGGGGAAWASGGGFGGAEDGDDRGAEELGEVHGAGVVGEEETALAEAGGEFFEGRLSGEVFGGGADE